MSEMASEKGKNRPNRLVKAPMEYAPLNELGVVFLFSHVARKLHLRIEEIRPAFPDCIAYRMAGESERMVRIEFELRSSNFRAHRHNPSGCDCIVCWLHDWPDAPKNLEIIELRQYFGAVPKVWIQPVIRSQQHNLESASLRWGVSKRARPADLLLMYRCFPECKIADLYRLESELEVGSAGWRDGICCAGTIRRLCKLASPVFLDDLRGHRILKTSSFVRRNMQGNLLVSEYWPYLYEMIIARNPLAKKALKEWLPEKMM